MLAVNEFREFLTFYPTHQRADYAQYKLGMAHFHQMRGPQRDQTETREAIKELERLRRRATPNSAALIAGGQKQLREAQDRLSDRDYRVGSLSTATSGIPGAIDASRRCSRRPGVHPPRRASTSTSPSRSSRSQRPAEALPYFERLVKEFEQSEFLEQAQKRMTELKALTVAKNRSVAMRLQPSRSVVLIALAVLVAAADAGSAQQPRCRRC